MWMVVADAVYIFQEMRISGVPFPSAAPSHTNALNSGGGHTMRNMYNQAAGGPQFSNNATVKPPYIGSTDVTTLSPAEVYRQQHEVTATVCILACVGIDSISCCLRVLVDFNVGMEYIIPKQNICMERRNVSFLIQFFNWQLTEKLE